MLKPETLLHNRYYIKRAIGQGGMGAVYEALDRQTRQTVAVKQTFFSGDERLDKAFRREAHILEQLQHPALPVVVEFFADDESKYLVMQFVQGDDLAMQLKAQGEAFDVTTVLAWTDQLLSVLVYLHNQEPPVIHRDIKPQNIKTTHSGDIILLDFGLAKGLAFQDSSTSAFKTILAYTPNFASLEQRRGQPTDARSDIYSLGATIYQLLTNVTPVDAMERAAELGVKGFDPLPPVKQMNPRIPTEVAEIVMQALKLNPEERPQSAIAMRAAMRDAWEISQDRAEAKTVFEPASETDAAPVIVETAPPPSMAETIRDAAPDSLSEAETKPQATAPVAPAAVVTDASTTSKKRRGQSYKVWSVILGFGFVAVIAGSFLWTTSLQKSMSSPPAESPEAANRPQSTTTAPPTAAGPSQPILTARSEYLRYYIEAETTAGASTLNGLDSLPTGRFKLHLRSPQAVFLYVVWTSIPSGKVSTGLTNKPSESSGITSNKLAPNADFSFPASRFKQIDKADSQLLCTMILSPTPITELSFLDDRPQRELTTAEQTALKTYKEKHLNSSMETKRDGNSAVVTIQSGTADQLVVEFVLKTQ